jgi:hypothetical protein
MEKLHQLNITFGILTKGSEPLALSYAEKVAIEAGFAKVISETVDLRYYPESRHMEEHHKLLGTTFVVAEVKE